MTGRLIEREQDLAEIVRSMHVIGVVGIKDGRDPQAPAYSIPKMLADDGHRIVGVNPTLPAALGSPTLASEAELAEGVDVLDVFRRIDVLPELAAELVALPPERRPKVVWLQSGIRDDDVAAQLVTAGFDVVQDRCLGVYWRRYSRR